VKPGEKYQKEGWEGVWVWGFFGSLGLGVVAYAFKPDTSYVRFDFLDSFDIGGFGVEVGNDIGGGGWMHDVGWIWDV